MTTPLIKRAFWVAAAIAGAAEGVVIYTQWPSPPLKVCASMELGRLLAAANVVESELRDARAQLRTGMGDNATRDVMRLEVTAAAAWNEVALFKQKDVERQMAAGKAGRGQSCG